MRHIYIFILLVAVSFSGCKPKEPSASDYPNADAVYLSLTKTFLLNKDGSMVERVEKKQKLFTYHSFHSLYGETRIDYNPDYQKVNVIESYTVMADGKKEKTPENGYNKVLPRSCAGSKAYNRMRELVVSHIALERNAVINCTYEIVSAKGFYPFLMGNEPLEASCPIRELKIVVEVPEGTPLNYQLYGYDSKPEVGHEGGKDIYEWDFKDIPQHVRESHEFTYTKDFPRLVFSTQKDRKELMDKYADQQAFKKDGFEMPESVKKAVAGDKSDIKKALKLQQIVVDELNLLSVPDKLAGFRYRTAKSVWNSNAGTAMEKAILLSSLMTSAGINNLICVEYPDLLNDDKSPLILASTPVIIANIDGKKLTYFSPVSKNSNSDEIGKPGYSCIPAGSKIEQILTFDPVEGGISVTGDLTLSGNQALNGFMVGSFSGSSSPYLKVVASANAVKNMLPGWIGKLDSLGEQKIKVVFNGENKNAVKVRGDYCFVNIPSAAGGLNSRHLLPLGEERKLPFYFGQPLKESYRVTLTLPAGYELIAKKISKKIKNASGTMSVEIEQSGDAVRVNKSIEIAKAIIPASEFKGFKELVTEWNLKKYNELVLKMK